MELEYVQTIKNTAQIIHNFIYNNIKLSDQEHATFIAGALIALQDSTFRATYKTNYQNDANYFIESMMGAIKHSIKSLRGFNIPEKQDIIIAEFDFIKRNEKLKEIVFDDGKEKIAIQALLEKLENIFDLAKTYPAYDILGIFYDQFTKYSASDQQSLGIVLTPYHISDFMSILLDVHENDVVLDTCCGSSSLLLTAGGVAKQSLGVELNARMTAISIANMVIKNLPTHLWLGDSFNTNIKKEIKEYHPNKFIINPPYSQQDSELSFVLNGLELLEEGGLGVVILPTTCVGTGDNATIKLKEDLLKSHTLLATVSLHDKVFAPAVSVRTSILLWKAHIPNGNNQTQMLRIEDDGFVVVKNKGRQDIFNKWEDIKTNILNLYNNKKELNGKSIIKHLTSQDSWNIENHIKYDGSLVPEENFAKKLQEYYDFLNPPLPYPTDNRLENCEWKDFFYTDLFNFERGKGPKSVEAEQNIGTVPFVAAANNNNGVRFLTDAPALYKAGTISIGNSGNGACGIAYYHSYPYTAASTATILIPKDNFDEAAGIFIATIISQEHETHGFGNGLSNTVLKTLTLSLPIDDNGKPNYHAMSNYIKSLPNYKN